MKRIVKISMFAIVVMGALVFNSCCHDDVYKTILQYTVSCSEDLLQFATPIVTYIDVNGTTQTIELKSTDFVPSTTDGDNNLEWKCAITFDHWNVEHEISVKYKLIPNVSGEAGKTYRMSHYIYCAVTPYSETWEGLKKTIDMSGETIGTDDIVVTFDYNDVVLNTYLDLLQQKDDKLGVEIDEEGSIRRTI